MTTEFTNGRAVKRRVRRKLRLRNIALHYVPVGITLLAVVAGAWVSDHNAKVREDDRNAALHRECLVLAKAVQANRSALTAFVIRLTTPQPGADEAAQERAAASQARFIDELETVYESQPLPDCKPGAG